MGLRDLTIAEEVVETPGGSFNVRGLNIDDLAYLIRKHGAAMEGAYERFMNVRDDTGITSEDVKEFLLPLMEYAPALMTELIACAADDLDAAPVVRRLSLPVQIDALEKTAHLTFAAAGGPKKFVETVTRLVSGTTGLLKSLEE